jgi:hypothetical protein
MITDCVLLYGDRFTDSDDAANPHNSTFFKYDSEQNDIKIELTRLKWPLPSRRRCSG